jgi:predicted TIM-barrel fold metal-dependent hydrolase
VLDAHEEAAHGLFRGIRHAGACDPHPGALRIPGRAPAELYERADFRAGLARLGERGLTYDTWQYHHQLPAFERLARAVPDTTLVLDHFSTPLGVGAYRGQRESIFERWKHDLAAVAACPNVVAKLGGLAMPDNGFGWSERNSPASSDEIATAHAPYYHHALECFGANRCMLESNFPVDKLSVSYAVLWNGLKKLVAACTDEEKDHLFSGTAERTYRI